MHSHYGLQIQDYVSAPFLILNSDQPMNVDQDHTVMLRDFSYTASDQILRNLENGVPGGGTAMAWRMSHFVWNRVREFLCRTGMLKRTLLFPNLISTLLMSQMLFMILY